MIQYIDKLTKEQFKELQEALQKAFISFDEFKQMFKFTFDEAISNKVDSDKNNLNTLAFNLIEWAESEGLVHQLIEGALKEKPNNLHLKTFVDKITPKDKTNILPNKYFTPNVLITELTPENILSGRAKTYKEFYYKREFDQEMYERVLNGESILLLGNSLAGKTRAIYEMLKELARSQPNTYILFPQNEVLDIPVEIPLKESYRHIAFIEDIDDYYKADNQKPRNYDKMLQILRQKNVQILATCRTGPEYQEFKKLSNSKVREVFKVLTVNKVSREIVNAIDKELIGDIEKSEFDGNIGSLFMELMKMRARYEELERDTQNKTAQLAIQILRSLRAFYFASNFTSKSVYDAEAVKDYCLRLTIDKYVSPLKEPAQELEAKLKPALLILNKDKIIQFNERLPEALGLLESDENNLNFIEQTDYWIKIEEVYLEKIVKYNPFTIVKDINKLYDAKNEKQKRGFYVKTDNYNSLLRKVATYSQSVGFFNQLEREKGIKPNSETFCIMIEKTETYKEALFWFNQLKDRKLPITIYLLFEMINKCENFETAYSYLPETLNLLLVEIEENSDIENSYATLTDLIIPKMLIENHIFDYLMSYFDSNISISASILNKIITNCRMKINIETYLNWMQEFQIEHNKTTLNALLNKTNSIKESLDLLKNKQFINIKMDSGILSSMLQKTSSLKEGLDLLENPKFINIPFDSIVLHLLLQKTSSLKEGLDLLENPKFTNIPSDFIMLINLIQKATSLQEGLDLLENPKFINFPPDSIMLVNLVQKTTSLQEGLNLLENPKFINIPSDSIMLINLAQKATSLKEGSDLLENQKFINISPDAIVLKQLLQKTTSLQESLGLTDNEKFKNIPWDSATLSTLLQKTTSLQEGLDLLQNEKLNNISLDSGVINTLLQKITSVQDGLDLLENEKFKNIFLGPGTLDHLLQRVQSTLEVKEIVKFANYRSISMINRHFLQSMPNYLSLYQDLNDFLFFWENYKTFQIFDFLAQTFNSFDEVVVYFLDFTPKSRFMYNHMLFILLNQKLIITTNQKTQIWEIMKNSRQGDDDERKKYMDKLLFSDIKTLWDNYVFKT